MGSTSWKNDGLSGLTYFGNAPGFGPVWIAHAADFGLDGVDDIVAWVGSPDPLLSVFTNDGAGAFESTYATDVVPGDPFYVLEVGDYDGNGLPDAAVIEGGVVVIRAGDGYGALLDPQSFPLVDPAEWLISGDFDGDGRDDLVVFHEGMAGETLLRNTTAAP